MIKSNSIGSIYKGTEHFYIDRHFRKNNNSVVYIARNDREIFSLYEKLKWILPEEKIYIFRSWDHIPYDNVSPSKERVCRGKSLWRKEKKGHWLVNVLIMKGTGEGKSGSASSE